MKSNYFFVLPIFANDEIKIKQIISVIRHVKNPL